MQIECPRCKYLLEVADHLAGPPPISVMAVGKTDGGAIASLILALLSFFCLGPFLQIPAVIVGHLSLGRIRRSNGTLGGRGLALTGVIAGYVGMVISVLTIIILVASIMIPVLARAREAARHAADQNNLAQLDLASDQNDLTQVDLAACQNNLKQHGLICRMYAGESRGNYFPPMSPEPGRLMYALEDMGDLHGVYPEYMTDLSVMFCPLDTDVSSGDPAVDLDDHSYFYINYTIDSDESAEAFADAYVAAMMAGEDLPDQIQVAMGHGAGGLDTIRRVKEGVERFLITDINYATSGSRALSVIPVMIERLGNHEPEGGNVLYMDGHVAFIRYPSKFPMTARTMAALERMDQAKSPESR